MVGKLGVKVKRFLDLFLVIVGAVIWGPILLLLLLLVRAKLGSPIFFVQVRPGLHGQPFKLIKFRTMTDARNAGGCLLPDSKRMTRFGCWLRATSLDELPELWNVLRGDMSLVGPRPLLMEYLPLYSSEQARRHSALPGITGWAQIHGRNAISWEEKFRLDVWYVDHQTIWIDIKILWQTLAKVFAGHGISAEGEATMPRFTGGHD
jgi:sugar transferase EpsL